MASTKGQVRHTEVSRFHKFPRCGGYGWVGTTKTCYNDHWSIVSHHPLSTRWLETVSGCPLCRYRIGSMTEVLDYLGQWWLHDLIVISPTFRSTPPWSGLPPQSLVCSTLQRLPPPSLLDSDFRYPRPTPHPPHLISFHLTSIFISVSVSVLACAQTWPWSVQGRRLPSTDMMHGLFSFTPGFVLLLSLQCTSCYTCITHSSDCTIPFLHLSISLSLFVISSQSQSQFILSVRV